MKISETKNFEKWATYLIYRYGLEHKLVVFFCKLAEEYEYNEWNIEYFDILFKALSNFDD